jgi:hypothetical protein
MWRVQIVNITFPGNAVGDIELYDNITVYDGYDTNAKLLGFTRFQTPEYKTFKSSQKYMAVQFKTNFGGTAKGFNAYYKSISRMLLAGRLIFCSLREYDKV